MINVLQIVAKFPLFNLNMPPTNQAISSMIVEISSFNLLPPSAGGVWTFPDDAPLNDNFNELNIF